MRAVRTVQKQDRIHNPTVTSSGCGEGDCSKKCSKHLHAQRTKEEYEKSLNGCFVPPWSFTVFCEGKLIISAKPLFIGSIPIAASNYNLNHTKLIGESRWL
jgi:hypothetical protein